MTGSWYLPGSLPPLATNLNGHKKMMGIMMMMMMMMMNDE